MSNFIDIMQKVFWITVIAKLTFFGEIFFHSLSHRRYQISLKKRNLVISKTNFTSRKFDILWYFILCCIINNFVSFLISIFTSFLATLTSRALHMKITFVQLIDNHRLLMLVIIVTATILTSSKKWLNSFYYFVDLRTDQVLWFIHGRRKIDNWWRGGEGGSYSWYAILMLFELHCILRI